jgi:transcriptional regulator with XRE-family HTH domain
MRTVDESPWSALGALIRERRAAAGLSLRDLASRTSVSNAYLSQIERGLHEPSLGVLRAVADALDVPLGGLLEQAGVLERGDHDGPAVAGATERAIQSDPSLTEAQRFALLSIYRSFVPAGRG